MPVSDILARPQPGMKPLTNQELADFALEADRARRRAMYNGDLSLQIDAMLERNALCGMLRP